MGSNRLSEFDNKQDELNFMTIVLSYQRTTGSTLATALLTKVNNPLLC